MNAYTRHAVIRAAIASTLSAACSVAFAQTTTTAPNTQPLEEVIVTGRIDFTENDAFGATKMGLPVKDTPQTINVVTADLIEVANLQTFEDFYKVDASTGVMHFTDGRPRNYYRGFFQDGANATRVDGFRMPGNIELDLAIFDRFEVVKGATSTLYGQNNIGGSLNAVSKLPQQERHGEFSAEVAQYDEYRVEADLTGALFGSENWSYRLIGAFEDADSYIDFAKKDVEMVSGSIMYQPSDATRVILRYTHQDNNARYAYGNNLQLAGSGDGFVEERALAEGLRVANVPRSTFFGMPWNFNDKKVQFVQLQAEHAFGEWRVRAHAQYSKNEERGQNFWAGGPIDERGFEYINWSFREATQGELYGAEVNVFGDFDLFGLESTLFLGVDYADIQNDGRTAESFNADFGSSIFNVFAPDYTAFAGPPDWNAYDFFYGMDDRQKLFGTTLQLILRPTQRLSLVAGARYSDDKVENGFLFAFTPEEIEATPIPVEDISVSKTVFQVGAAFEITQAVNVYASYGRTYEPQNSRVFVEGDTDGRLIDPLEGESTEVGLKAELNPDLLFTTALFELEKSNIAVSDPLNGFPFAFPIGRQRSRGAELGLQGKLAPAWSANLSLAWMDAEYLEGPFDGLQPANAPKFGVSLFTTYELLGGPLEGLGFGLGLVHKSGRKGFDAFWTEALGEPVIFDFGDFTEVDASVFYTRGSWSASLHVTNLLDETYYSQTFEELGWSTNVNPPSIVRAKLAYRF